MWNKAVVVVVVVVDDDKNDLQQDVTDGFNHLFTILTFVPVSEVTNSNSRWLYLPLVLILIYAFLPSQTYQLMRCIAWTRLLGSLSKRYTIWSKMAKGKSPKPPLFQYQHSIVWKTYFKYQPSKGEGTKNAKCNGMEMTLQPHPRKCISLEWKVTVVTNYNRIKSHKKHGQTWPLHNE